MVLLTEAQVFNFQTLVPGSHYETVYKEDAFKTALDRSLWNWGKGGGVCSSKDQRPPPYGLYM